MKGNSNSMFKDFSFFLSFLLFSFFLPFCLKHKEGHLTGSQTSPSCQKMAHSTRPAGFRLQQPGAGLKDGWMLLSFRVLPIPTHQGLIYIFIYMYNTFYLTLTVYTCPFTASTIH